MSLPKVPEGPSLAQSFSSNEKDVKLSTESLDIPEDLYVDGLKIEIPADAPPLANFVGEDRWTWLNLIRPRRRAVALDAIATRPSVFDDPRLASHYTPRYVSSQLLAAG